jgi:hypothetical protein
MPDTNLRSLVVAEISIWQLMSGDPAAAKKTVLSTQESRPDAFLAAAVLFARADEPADKWRAEVLSSPFDENSKQTLLGYGFFLHGRYADSVPVWRGILNRSGDTDLHARVMLASSLRHNSQQDEARKIRVQPFFPDLGDPYAAIPFRELTGMLR